MEKLMVSYPPAEAAPREWWTVAPLLTNPSKWLCVRRFADGTGNQLSPCPRDTEAAARADGEASGLPMWPDEVPEKVR
jgi:hypothetical protein